MKDESYFQNMEGFLNTPFDKELELEFFKELATLESAAPYFRMTLEQDLKRHFVSDSPMAQAQVKGAAARTQHFLKGMLRSKESKVKSIVPEKRRMK